MNTAPDELRAVATGEENWLCLLSIVLSLSYCGSGIEVN